MTTLLGVTAMGEQFSLSEVMRHQQGVATRSQLVAAGVSDPVMGRKVRRGEWQRLLPGVYRVREGAMTLEIRRIAVALFAGESAQLTGAATLLWYGFRSPLAGDRVHALVPHETRCRSTGFAVVQRTLALDANARDVGLYRITSPARAVVDACRAMGDLQMVRAVVTEAVQQNHASIAAIEDEVGRAGRSRTALVRRVLTEVTAGVRSSPEAELRDITTGSDLLPEILWNPELARLDGTRLPTPDGWIDEVALALEVDSAEHHAADDGWRRTLGRSNELAALGAGVLHITPAEIRLEPKRVLRMIEGAYRARKGMSAPIKVIERAPL